MLSNCRIEVSALSSNIMNIKDYERIQLKTNFLTQVLCQVRFNEILEITNSPPVDFYEKIRDKYPKSQQSIRIDNPGLSIISGRIAKQPEVHYQFIDVRGKWKVELIRDRLTLNSFNYLHFEDFKERFLELVDYLQQCYNNIEYKYLGLRYIDEIEREKDLSGGNWSDAINENLLGLLSSEVKFNGEKNVIPIEKLTGYFQDLRLKDEKRNKRLVFKFGVPPDLTTEFVLDIDYAHESNFKFEGLKSLMEELHRETNNIFRWSVKDSFLEKFKEGEN